MISSWVFEHFNINIDETQCIISLVRVSPNREGSIHLGSYNPKKAVLATASSTDYLPMTPSPTVSVVIEASFA